MDALTRTEYPAMLERLQPAAAASKFKERVQKIGKINADIADWMQERRKVEDAYVAGLRKLSQKPPAMAPKELGIFEHPWMKINGSMREIAVSHETLSQQIEKNIELPLRSFMSTNPEYSGIATIQSNLISMAKDQEDAQEKSDKLTKKGGKANAAKVDMATQRLHAANGQWDAQAPFMFEKLQSLDEIRTNHLRDVLTQYETLEADTCDRDRSVSEQILGILLEIDTSTEIQSWSQSIVAGRPITAARQLSNAGTTSTAAAQPPPPTPRSAHTTQTDNSEKLSERRTSEQRASDHFNRLETAGEEKPIKKSRFGTMLNRRRQSIHNGFARAPSPSKGGSGGGSSFPTLSSFGRSSSRDGRPTPSPRTSSGNLRASPAPDHRLSALPESPSSPPGNTNNFNQSTLISDSLPGPSHTTNGTGHVAPSHLSDVQPPEGPPPSRMGAEIRTDSEGFTMPTAMNDPISQAQQEAAQEGEQPQFKLDIRNEPIPEQDADAQAALSNVAHTLRSAQATTPSRKMGTLRGRRDVRNTIYVPSNSLDVTTSEHPFPPSPGIAMGRAAALASLSSGGDHSAPSPSDTTSIRSGRSLSNTVLAKHAEMHQPGLNASIIETVSATLENGEVKTLKVSGEVALIYNKTESDDPSSPAQETIRINNFPNLEAIGPNRTFIHQVSDEKTDEYTIDLSAISKSAVAFTYKVHMDDENVSANGPLLIKPTWKPQGDKLGFIIEYRLNPAYGERMLFHNLIILGCSTGPRATTCQTKPTGTQYKDKSLVVWQLGDVNLSQDWQKIICRLTGSEGAPPQAGHIEARWEFPDASVSGINFSRLEPGKGKEKEEIDPFADESIVSPTTTSPVGNWVAIQTSRKLAAGKYEAR